MIKIKISKRQFKAIEKEKNLKRHILKLDDEWLVADYKDDDGKTVLHCERCYELPRAYYYLYV